MDNVGERAAGAIEAMAQANGRTVRQELSKLGIYKRSYDSWKTNDYHPSGKCLQRMALRGYDVVRILVGGGAVNAEAVSE